VLSAADRPAAAQAAPARCGWLVGPVHRFALVPDGTTRIGRQPENDLVIDRPGIGGFHAQVVSERDRWLLVDSGSPDGIAVNDRPDADFLPLQHGDRIHLGADIWRFELTEAAATTSTAGVVGYLCPESGPDAGSALAIRLRNGQAIIGRGDAAQLRLADPLVSRRHALVRAVGGGLELLDQGSANGVQVNGQRVEAATPWRLQDGNELRMGAYAYRFSTRLPTGRRLASASSDTAGNLGSTVLARRPAQHEVAAPRLRLEAKPSALFPTGATVELDGDGAGVLRIGRSRDVLADGKGLVIPAVTVSRSHAELAPVAGRWTLRDLGSREGTRRNGEPVGEAPVPLRDGDVLVFGHVAEFDVRIDAEAAALAPGRAANRTLSRQPLSSAFWLAPANALETDLRAMVETELDACIGCHACMRACPLPDAENVSIAALNQSAASGRIADPRARRFVQDCTQCQQCVPVCPVNIQRSRIVLWNKLKLDVDADQRPPLQVGAGAGAMDETVAELSRAHAEQELLGVLLERDRQELMSRCQYRLLSDGELLVTQGSYVSTLWIVHRGAVDWELDTGGGAHVGSLRLGPGKAIALREFVADEICERAARAVGTVTAIGVSRALVSQFARRSPALREVLTRLASEHDLSARVPELAQLTAAERALLDAQAEIALAAPGEALRGFAAGEQGALVLRGFVAELAAPAPAAAAATAEAPDIVRAYHRQGALLRLGGRGEPARHRAKTACELLLLPPAIEARLRELMAGRDTGLAGAGLAALPSGKRIMAIDVTRCVDCDNCVDACGRRHGHSRLDRRKQGVQIGVHHIPSACYHCEDPKCLLCDTGGIVRTEGGEIRIVEENCIGCGSCASRCPYDNIRMVPRETPAAPGVVGSLLQLLHMARPEPSPRAPGPRLAVKCDLCVDHADGPACVRACPTGAAQRVSLAELAAGAGSPD
jgi:pSer/pThr/pTyr-binding forkhead associated (FHA) protein/Fe-S-cluster-containing dehydrogenase component/CRP-like cAMP-binding protein